MSGIIPLTFSAYAAGAECERKLYFLGKAIRKGEAELPGMTMSAERESLAKRIAPDGIPVRGTRIEERLGETGRHGGAAIIGGSVLTHGTYAVIDILAPGSVTAVSDASSVQDRHLERLAYQAHALDGIGERRFRVAFRHGEGYASEEVTASVANAMTAVGKAIGRRSGILNGDVSERLARGCDDPSDCRSQAYCYPGFDATLFSLMNDRRKAKAHALFALGYRSIEGIPDEFLDGKKRRSLTAAQRAQRQAHLDHEPHLDMERLVPWLAAVEGPLGSLDFEFGDRIFQYSYHRTKEGFVGEQEPLAALVRLFASGKVTHHEFLAGGGRDEEETLLHRLVDAVDLTVPNLVYNVSTERSVIRRLTSRFPRHESWGEEAIRTLVDVYDLFREGIVYLPEQGGEASLKVMTNLLSAKSYRGKEVANGREATMTHAALADMDPIRAQLVRNALLDYCAFDTRNPLFILAMVASLARDTTLFSVLEHRLSTRG